MTYEVPVTQARAELADLINRVVYGGERIVVTRHGKPIAALVSAADLRTLEEQDGAAGERAVGTASSVATGPSAAGERSRFGIAAWTPGPSGAGADGGTA